ncbi:unnamed protein product [Pleuronectes platessa]|uniref:Secreted protein n=1 Tax=Pleuronectes platessa TaxID=8262 RepID=A0A9N7VRY9_PLEPL|nr:unnamed protein product [Pleuronectes platessa]
MQVDRSRVVSSAWCACLLLLYSTPSTRVTEVGATHQSIPPSVVKLWASAFGGEIKSISAKYSGSQLLQKVSFRCRAEKNPLQHSHTLIQRSEPEHGALMGTLTLHAKTLWIR